MNTDNKRKVGQEEKNEGISSLKRTDEQFQGGQQQDYSKRMDPQQVQQGQDVGLKGDQQRVSGGQRDIGGLGQQQQQFPYQQQGKEYGNQDVAGQQGKIGTSTDINDRMGRSDINPEPSGMGSDIKTQRSQQQGGQFGQFGQFEGGVKGQESQEDWLKQGGQQQQPGLQGQQQAGFQGQQQAGLQGHQQTGGLHQGGLQHEQREVGKVHEGVEKPLKGKSPQQGRKGEKEWGETPSKKGDMSQEEWARQHKEERTAQQQTK